MNLQATREPWRQLADYLESDEAALRQLFPTDTGTCGLLDALGNRDVAATEEHAQQGERIQEDLSGLLKQLNVFESMSRCPILAITGLLNAGKSSLLATYLTPENRARVLTGITNQAGTHRFVLWLPRVWWDDPELLTTLISFLTNLFGHPPEQLSMDADVAALQYNGQVVSSEVMQSDTSSGGSSSRGAEVGHTRDVDPIRVPLIAYDEALNDLKLGLIDCPDIQTGFLSQSTPSQGEELADARRDQLAIIGRLCSAFLVVAKLNSLHDDGLIRILTTLRDAMPGVPRLLAVNKVKARYSPTVVHEQARGLIDRFGIGAVFAAYDYRSAMAHSRIPARPSSMKLAVEEDLPIFFEASTASENQPAQAPEYLHHLGNRLDAGSLSRESSRSLTLQLKTHASSAIRWLEKNEQLRQTQVTDAWQAVADACYEFMAERDASGRATGLRLQASPAIVAQMADSLQRTAPMWMKVSLSIDRTARQLHQAISNSAARIKLLQGASESVTQFAKRFRRGEGARVVTPAKLAEAIRSSDIHDAFQRTPVDRLTRSCELAMKRFAAEDTTQLNETELDAWSRQVWAGMSFKDKLWKGTQPLAVVMAPLLAAVLVPFDGGGSAVLVFASTKELLAAAGIAAVMTPMATGGETLGIVQRETPWRQLSDLFALVCDSVGVPRPTSDQLPQARCEGQDRSLLPSSLEMKLGNDQPAIQVWELPPKHLQQFQLITNTL